jgi:hypothetical protein
MKRRQRFQNLMHADPGVLIDWRGWREIRSRASIWRVLNGQTQRISLRRPPMVDYLGPENGVQPRGKSAVATKATIANLRKGCGEHFLGEVTTVLVQEAALPGNQLQATTIFLIEGRFSGLIASRNLPHDRHFIGGDNH